MLYGLPWWLSGKESACNAGDQGSIPGLGRSPGGGQSNPLQYFCLENSMDRGAWWATVHRVAQSRTWLKQVSGSSKTRCFIFQLILAESAEELKSLLMKVKEESEKGGLKLNIQKTKTMASGPITSWETDRETVADFFRGSEMTADGDCSHEIKRRLLLGRKVLTNLDSILKSRHITLSTKVCLVKAVVFPVVMWMWVGL